MTATLIPESVDKLNRQATALFSALITEVLTQIRAVGAPLILLNTSGTLSLPTELCIGTRYGEEPEELDFIVAVSVADTADSAVVYTVQGQCLYLEELTIPDLINMANEFTRRLYQGSLTVYERIRENQPAQRSPVARQVSPGEHHFPDSSPATMHRIHALFDNRTWHFDGFFHAADDYSHYLRFISVAKIGPDSSIEIHQFASRETY